MSDRIVYKLITKPGGVDGSDFNDNGGIVIAAFLSRSEAERHGSAPWCEIVADVYDLEKVKSETIASLDPIQRLALKSCNHNNPRSGYSES